MGSAPKTVGLDSNYRRPMEIGGGLVRTADMPMKITAGAETAP